MNFCPHLSFTFSSSYKPIAVFSFFQTGNLSFPLPWAKMVCQDLVNLYLSFTSRSTNIPKFKLRCQEFGGGEIDAWHGI